MIRKWEWVREYCKRQGFEKSTEIADQMDRVLCYVYGDANTEYWEERIRDSWKGINESGEIDIDEGDVLTRVIGSGLFCIACAVNKGEDCADCEFCRLTGKCNDVSSLFMGFVDKYREESE